MAGYSFDPNAPDGTEVTLSNGVTYKYDSSKNKWSAVEVEGGVDTGAFVKRVGGDSMEGPLTIQAQEPANARDTKKIITYGMFSNSDGSALRLGTTRDRVYVGHNDTSFNGPIKVDEIDEKNAGTGTTFSCVLYAAVNVEHVPSGVTFTDLIDGVEQNKQDIITLSQSFADVHHSKMAGRYRLMTTPAPREGELTIQDNSYTNTGNTVVYFNVKDLNGYVNTGSDIDPGDVLEIFNVSDEGFGTYEVISSSVSGGLVTANVKHVRGYKAPITGLECRIRLINIADIDVGISDLDERYLEVAGDTATGPMVFNNTLETKKKVSVQRTTVSGTAGEGFTLFGRVPSNSSVSQKILQLYHNSDSSGDALNYYGKESASTNLMSRSGINALITGKGYATETYVDNAIPDATPDATNSTKGIAKLGQVQTGSGPASGGLATGCLYFDTTNKVLYIG
jgi:hypothetical protein